MKHDFAPATPERRPVPQGVAQYLLDLVAGEGLKPGDRLPSERELVQRLGISRSSVRQAISALESRGMISVQPGRGVFVAASSPDNPVWRFSGSSPRDVYEARICIETFAAGLAATRLRAQELADLKESVSTLREAAESGDIRRMAKADSTFHDLIIGACGNPIVQAMYATVREMMVESQKLPMMSRTRLDETVAEHQALLDRLLARDAERASLSMRDHIRAAAARLGIAV